MAFTPWKLFKTMGDMTEVMAFKTNTIIPAGAPVVLPVAGGYITIKTGGVDTAKILGMTLHASAAGDMVLVAPGFDTNIFELVVAAGVPVVGGIYQVLATDMTCTATAISTAGGVKVLAVTGGTIAAPTRVACIVDGWHFIN